MSKLNCLNQRRNIIEFFGPIGAGKSTIINKLKQNHISLTIHKKILADYQEKHSKLLSDFSYLYKKANDLGGITSDLSQEEQLVVAVSNKYGLDEGNSKRVLWFLADLAAAKVINEQDCFTEVMIDEGPVQRLLGLSLCNYSKLFVDKYINILMRINYNHTFIYVSSPLDTLIERVNSRAGYRHSQQEIISSYYYSRELYKLLDFNGANVLCVENLNSIDNAVKSILSRLE